MENTNSANPAIKYVVYGVIILFVLILMAVVNPFVVIDPGERGVVTRLGKIQDNVLGEGFHIVVPFIDDVHVMDTKLQTYAIHEQNYSKDGQIITADITLQYELDNVFVKEIYTELRNESREKMITPMLQESIKTSVSSYTAQGLLENRSKLALDIKGSLVSKLDGRGVIVRDITTNIDFDDEYEASIKRKQVAEQDALAAANKTNEEEEKKKQEILKAQALAEKTRLEAQALASQQGEKVIEKIRAEAMLEASKRWNGQLPTQMVPGGALPFIDVGTK